MGAGFDRLLGQSCSHGEHIKCSPARAELAIDQTPRPVPASLWLVTTIKKQQGAPPFINGGAPTHIYLSAHPALQTKKADEQSDASKQRYLRTWAGV